jgi:hypothetical protein
MRLRSLTGHEGLDAASIDLNQTAMNYIAVGRLKDSESTLSTALANPTRIVDKCLCP